MEHLGRVPYLVGRSAEHRSCDAMDKEFKLWMINWSKVPHDLADQLRDIIADVQIDAIRKASFVAPSADKAIALARAEWRRVALWIADQYPEYEMVREYDPVPEQWIRRPRPSPQHLRTTLGLTGIKERN